MPRSPAKAGVHHLRSRLSTIVGGDSELRVMGPRLRGGTENEGGEQFNRHRQCPRRSGGRFLPTIAKGAPPAPLRYAGRCAAQGGGAVVPSAARSKRRPR